MYVDVTPGKLKKTFSSLCDVNITYKMFVHTSQQ